VKEGRRVVTLNVLLCVFVFVAEPEEEKEAGLELLLTGEGAVKVGAKGGEKERRDG
jgi:hypothetical protein